MPGLKALEWFGIACDEYQMCNWKRAYEMYFDGFGSKADFSKSPCWFDFVVKDSAQKLSTMKSIFLIQGNDV